MKRTEPLHKAGHLENGDLTLIQTEQTRKSLSLSVRRHLAAQTIGKPVSLADFGWNVKGK